MARQKAGMSYGELADYQDLVSDVRQAATRIIEVTDDYWLDNGGLVCDGGIYSDRVKALTRQIEEDLKGIRQYCRKYGDL